MKKIVLVALSLVLGIIIAIFLYPQKKSPVEAIPETSALSVYTNDLNTLLSVSWLDSLLPENGKMEYELFWAEQLGFFGDENPSAAAFVSGRNSGLLIIDLPKAIQPDSLTTRIEKIAAIEKKTFNFKGEEIYVVDGKENLSFAFYKNLFLISREALLIESAFERLLDKGSTAFSNLNTNKSGFRIFIQPDFLSALYAGTMTAKGEEIFEQWSASCSFLQLGGQPGSNVILEGQVRLKDMKEVANQKDTKSSFLQLLENIPSGSGKASLKHFDFDLLDKTHDFSEFLLPWIADEVGFIGEPTGGGQQDFCFVLKEKQSGAGEKYLKGIPGSPLEQQQYDYGMFSISHIPGNSVFAPFGFIGEVNSKPLAFTSIENYVLVASSAKVLESVLDEILVGNVLAKNENILLSLSDVPGSMNLLSMINGMYLGSMFEEVRLEDAFVKKQLIFNTTSLDKNGVGEIKIKVTASDPHLQKGRKLWDFQLNSNAITQPFVFEDMIFIQDDQNRLYAISETGQELWQKRLPNFIFGSINFKKANGGFQLFFNTPEAIFGMDMTGEPIPGFPIPLNEIATAPMTIVDFSHNGNYSFFVPCGDKILGYEKGGNPIIGWNPLPLSAGVNFPIIHFQFGGKDYFSFVTEDSLLNTKDRFGEELLPEIPLENELHAAPDFQLEYNSKVPGINRIVATDKKGKVLVMNPAGDHFKLRLKCGDNHNTGFVFSDFTGEGRKDYLAFDDKTVSLSGYHDLKFHTFFEEEMPGGDLIAFSIERPCPSGALIGVISNELKKAYLLDAKGKMQYKFPLAATQPFVITYDKDCQQELIILVNNDELYVVE